MKFSKKSLKTIATLLVVAMLISVIVGCGSGGGGVEKKDDDGSYVWITEVRSRSECTVKFTSTVNGEIKSKVNFYTLVKIIKDGIEYEGSKRSEVIGYIEFDKRYYFESVLTKRQRAGIDKGDIVLNLDKTKPLDISPVAAFEYELDIADWSDLSVREEKIKALAQKLADEFNSSGNSEDLKAKISTARRVMIDNGRYYKKDSVSKNAYFMFYYIGRYIDAIQYENDGKTSSALNSLQTISPTYSGVMSDEIVDYAIKMFGSMESWKQEYIKHDPFTESSGSSYNECSCGGTDPNCPMCKGTGKSLPAAANEQWCGTCGGTGKKNNTTCSTCNGSGKVK